MSSDYSATTGTDGDVTSYVPLTTTFTPPPGCRSSYRLSGPTLMAYDPNYAIQIDPEVVCQPQQLTTWWLQDLFGQETLQHAVVSIGPVVCPSGWFTIGTTRSGPSSTKVNCCPTGYYWEDAVYGNCLSSIPSGSVLTYASSTNSEATASSEWTIVTTTLASDSTVGAIAVAGWNIAEETSTTSSSASTTANPATITSSAIATTTASPIPLNISSNEGPSSGVKAGISIGIAFGIVGILALLAAVYLLRRRNQGKTIQSKEPTTIENHWGKFELPNTEKPRAELSERELPETFGGYYKAGRDESPLVELEAEERPSEMDIGRNR